MLPTELPYIDIRQHAVCWGNLLWRIGDGTLKATNLNMFYELGSVLERMHEKLSVETHVADLYGYMVVPHNGLISFLESTKDMPLKDTRAAAQQLQAAIRAAWKSFQLNPDRNLTLDEVHAISWPKEEFDRAFEREHRNLDVFTVTKKGIYDTRALFENPEEKFPPNIRKVLPTQMLHDLKEAGRCLAFEIPTACAFHVCRGTEAVILAYYELLAKHPWNFKKKDWKIYVEQLCKEKAPNRITNRLDEIREFDRNSYIHPDVNVTLEEAPILFELCTGVVFLMGQEMGKVTT